MDSSLRIGFIGAGNMAQAIGISLIEKGKSSFKPQIIPNSVSHSHQSNDTCDFHTGLVKPDQICVSAPSNRNFKPWLTVGVFTTNDNRKSDWHNYIIRQPFSSFIPKPSVQNLAVFHSSMKTWRISTSTDHYSLQIPDQNSHKRVTRHIA